MKGFRLLPTVLIISCFNLQARSQFSIDSANCSLLMQVRTVGKFEANIYYPNDSLENIQLKIPEITKKNNVTYQTQLQVLNQEINKIINRLMVNGWRLNSVIHEEILIRSRYYYFEHIDCG